MCADGSLAIDEIWAKFKAIIAHCMTNFVPQVAKVTKNQNPWITRDIIHIKRKIKRLRKSNKSNSVNGFQEKINYLSRSLKVKIRSAKENFCSTTLSKFIRESPQKFWQYLGSNNNPPTVVSAEEELMKANKFNTYFQSVFTADNNKTMPLLFPEKNLSTLGLPQLSEPGLLSLLLNIDEKKR